MVSFTPRSIDLIATRHWTESRNGIRAEEKNLLLLLRIELQFLSYESRGLFFKSSTLYVSLEKRYKMYVQHWVVARTRNYCCHGSANMRFLFIVVGADVAGNNLNYSVLPQHAIVGSLCIAVERKYFVLQ